MSEKANPSKMKAVKKFKGLVEKKRPEAFAGTLGKGVRTLHPSSSSGDAIFEPGLDVDDRRNVEQALAIEGVHHDTRPTASSKSRAPIRVDSSVTMIDMPHQTSPERASHHHRGHKLHNDQEPQINPPELHSESSGEKGHAHDPMDERPLFLGIGGGGDESLELPPDEIVAESPTAAEFSIYDTAYQEEVERIRAAQGHSATVYLTRRVDSKTAHKADENMIDEPKQSEIEGRPHEGFKGLLDRAREKQSERAKDTVGGSSQTFSEITAKALESTKAMGKDLSDRSGAALNKAVQTAMEKRQEKIEGKSDRA
jgi:[calcium/calmodulin-dependent protein kinase] kinase